MILPLTLNYKTVPAFYNTRNKQITPSFRGDSITERLNPAEDLCSMSTMQMVRTMNNEDKNVALAVEKELPNIAKAIDIITEKFKHGGRLLYFGAGASGCMGVFDAAECPPTFGVSKKMVQGIIAGGNKAIATVMNNIEDDYRLGQKDARVLRKKDVCVVISASGNPDYLLGVLSTAKEKGATRIALTCNPEAKILREVDHSICTPVGPEVIAGSSRLKAATAQKMILNMLSTGSMVKMGKTYKNMMICAKPINLKLKERAARIVSEIAGVNIEAAKKVLMDCAWNAKIAVTVILGKVNKQDAKKLLKTNGGNIRKALMKIV